jgi:hypothetical protein
MVGTLEPAQARHNKFRFTARILGFGLHRPRNAQRDEQDEYHSMTQVPSRYRISISWVS